MREREREEKRNRFVGRSSPWQHAGESNGKGRVYIYIYNRKRV